MIGPFIPASHFPCRRHSQGFWGKGQAGVLASYAQDVLTKPIKTKTKVHPWELSFVESVTRMNVSVQIESVCFNSLLKTRYLKKLFLLFLL